VKKYTHIKNTAIGCVRKECMIHMCMYIY